MKRPLALLAILVAAGLAACGPKIMLSDDIDLVWDFGPSWTRFDATLNSPYVTGTPVTLHVTSTDDHQDFSGWSVESSDASVFAIDSQGYDPDGVSARAHTAGAGIAELVVYDAKHKVVGSGVAEVAAPDHIELDAHAYLIVGLDSEAPVGDVRILQGGTATYLVKYFNNGRELHGNGVLAVNASQGVVATPQTTFLFENREWLQLTATAGTQATIEMVVAGISHGTIPVTIVAETDLANVVVVGQPENGHKAGDQLIAFAQAYDAANNRIFGVDYTWHVDGVEQIGSGDLYRYDYKPGLNHALSAARGSLSDSTMIHSDGGYVDSSNRIGCSAGGSAGVLVGLAALALARRRRTR